MFRRIKKSLAGVLAAAVFGAMMFPTAAFAQASVSVTIPVTVRVSGSGAPSGTEFKLVIEGVDDAPMPEETTVVVVGSGDASFGPIWYTSPNDYQYRIYQESTSVANYTCDSTVYTVTVEIINDGDDGLTATVVAGKDGTTEKADEIVFTNTYSDPGSSSGGGDDSGDDDGTTTVTASGTTVSTGGSGSSGNGSSSGSVGSGGSSSGSGSSSGGSSSGSGSSTTSSDPGSGNSSGGGDGTPSSDTGETVEITDPDVELAFLPKTGDRSLTYGILLAVLLVSGVLAGGLYWKRNKMENTKN